MNIKIKIENLSKTFKVNKKPLEVLNNINIEVYENQFVSLIGPAAAAKAQFFVFWPDLKRTFQET